MDDKMDGAEIVPAQEVSSLRTNERLSERPRRFLHQRAKICIDKEKFALISCITVLLLSISDYAMRDIKIFLIVGYALAYPLAVVPPILIDPQLATHVAYGPRHYPNAEIICTTVFTGLMIVQLLLLRRTMNLAGLYASVVVFLVAAFGSLRVFLPEFPHGNVFAVSATTGFMSAFTIFVWWMCNEISSDAKSLPASGQASLEYLKTLFAFSRQGAFAGVSLFGVLFFAAFANEFKYSEATVTNKKELFLLNINTALQVAFFATYAVVGAVRYFFVMNLKVLARFREIATELDFEAKRPPVGANPTRTTGASNAPDDDEAEVTNPAKSTMQTS